MESSIYWLILAVSLVVAAWSLLTRNNGTSEGNSDAALKAKDAEIAELKKKLAAAQDGTNASVSIPASWLNKAKDGLNKLHKTVLERLKETENQLKNITEAMTATTDNDGVVDAHEKRFELEKELLEDHVTYLKEEAATIEKLTKDDLKVGPGTLLERIFDGIDAMIDDVKIVSYFEAIHALSEIKHSNAELWKVMVQMEKNPEPDSLRIEKKSFHQIKEALDVLQQRGEIQYSVDMHIDYNEENKNHAILTLHRQSQLTYSLVKFVNAGKKRFFSV